MAALPQPTIDAIYRAYEERDDGYQSRRLGASVLGRRCDRRLWLAFRHVFRERFNGRMLRLFETGHQQEARVVADLRAAGVEVWDVDPGTGNQFEYTSLDGHVVCKIDGVALGLPEAPQTPHLLEIKSANKKQFDKIEKEGCEKAKPEHFAQVQLGMGLADLTRAAYIVVCKDDERLYLERVNYEDKTFQALLLRAGRIIKAESPPARISQDPAFWVCKFCPFVDHCHGTAMPAANCRTCVHAQPAANGEWRCGNEMTMEPDCPEHIYIPDLLHWAEPINGDPSWVQYRIKSDGREFINCAESGFPAVDVPHYPSRELQHTQANAIADPAVETARRELGGEVVDSRGAG